MKIPFERHVGMSLLLDDGRKGKVLRVSSEGYTVKIKEGDRKTLVSVPLSEVKKTKDETGLIQKINNNKWVGKIVQLQNCSEHLLDTVVKVALFNKEKKVFNFLFSTGCGGEAQANSFKELTPTNGVVRIERRGGNNHILCDGCNESFAHEDINLYYARTVGEKNALEFKQGALCTTCYKIAKPILDLVHHTAEKIEDISFKNISSYDTGSLKTLNESVYATLKNTIEGHGLNSEIIHKQIRPTAMEYTVVVSLPGDSVKEKVVPIKKELVSKKSTKSIKQPEVKSKKAGK